MKHYKPRNVTRKPRRPKRKAESVSLAGKFLRGAFYYLALPGLLCMI